MMGKTVCGSSLDDAQYDDKALRFVISEVLMNSELIAHGRERKWILCYTSL